MSRSSEVYGAIAVVIVAVGALLAWEFVPSVVAVGCGAYDLAVRIESPDGVPHAVACSPFFDREVAAFAVEQDSLASPEWAIVVAPFDGREIIIRVPFSTRTSPMGRVLSRSQARYLGVVAVLKDDRRVGRVIAIPDRGASNKIVVVLSQESGHAEQSLAAESR
jgi:hypothetical protein